jgi:hypothetical protein
MKKKKLDIFNLFYSGAAVVILIGVIAKLLEGWKTWDMYALTILLAKDHPNLHYDASKRLTPAASRLASPA